MGVLSNALVSGRALFPFFETVSSVWVLQSVFNGRYQLWPNEVQTLDQLWPNQVWPNGTKNGIFSSRGHHSTAHSTAHSTQWVEPLTQKIKAPNGGPIKCGARRVGSPKFRAFLTLPTQFSFFLPSLGCLLVEFW